MGYKFLLKLLNKCFSDKAMYIIKFLYLVEIILAYHIAIEKIFEK